MAKKEIEFKYNKKINCKNTPIYHEYLNLSQSFWNFTPTFRPSVLAQKLPRKPTMIFFSMSDPVYWKPEWYEKILEKICDHMQHTFVILTKSPKIYGKFSFLHNCWLGVTVENQLQLNQLEAHLCNWLEIYNTFFLSIEPICGPIKISPFMKSLLDWVIVGPETGLRKNRIIAQTDWIEPFYDLKTRVFMKEACKQVIGRKLRQEWPEGYMEI